MITLDKSEVKEIIAKRVALELKDGNVVNLGIGIGLESLQTFESNVRRRLTPDSFQRSQKIGFRENFERQHAAILRADEFGQHSAQFRWLDMRQRSVVALGDPVDVDYARAR